MYPVGMHQLEKDLPRCHGMGRIDRKKGARIMDLRNNKITVGELLQNKRAKAILGFNFPEMMNPFLLNIAEKMSLENTLKLARGPDARDQIEKMITALKAV
jgi:hypothetical protein